MTNNKRKIDLKEYKKRKVVPTRLQYEDHYPFSTEYKTSDSIKFLKEYDFKKKKMRKKNEKTL